MEKEQLLEIISMYKQALADATEEKFAYQVMLKAQVKQIQELDLQIQNLQNQINEMNRE